MERSLPICHPEQDITRLPQRTAEARSAIFDRIQETITRSDSNERRMLAVTLDGLRVMQLEGEPETRKKAS